MMEINENICFERDTYGWKLHQLRDGKDKDGNIKKHTVTTYHANLRQVCDYAIDLMAGECASMSELMSLLYKTEEGLTQRADSDPSLRYYEEIAERVAE